MKFLYLILVYLKSFLLKIMSTPFSNKSSARNPSKSRVEFADKLVNSSKTTAYTADELLSQREVVVSYYTPVSGFSITAAPLSDSLTYLTPAGTLADGTFSLPSLQDARLGQIVRLHSTKEVTDVDIVVDGGGVIRGADVAQLAVEVTYAWQCVKTSGPATWVRI